jgi:hypothetical protein
MRGPGLCGREQVVFENLPGYSFAVTLAADISPAIGSFVIDPGYSRNNDQGIRCVSDGPPPFLLAPLSTDAPLDAVP